MLWETMRPTRVEKPIAHIYTYIYICVCVCIYLCIDIDLDVDLDICMYISYLVHRCSVKRCVPRA